MIVKVKKTSITLLLTSLMVYLSNGLFPMGYISAFIRELVLFFSLGVFFIYRKKKGIFSNQLMIYAAIAMIGLQAVTILFYGISVEFDIYLMLAIMIAVLFCSAIPCNDFIEQYKKMIFWIAVISSVLYFIGLLTPQLFRMIPTAFLQNSKWENAYTILGTFVIRFRTQYSYYRNFGIFSEPGQFQIFLNVGLLFELFFSSKIKRKNVIALIIAICTCNSTNGYLVMVALFMAYILNSYSKNEKTKKEDRRRIIMMILLGAVFIIIAFPNILLDMVQEMLEKITNLGASYSYSDKGTGLERRRAFDVALNMYAKNPITGLGYVGMDAFQKELNSEGFIMTCSPLNWFARFGTLYGLIANGVYLFFFTRKSKNVMCSGMLIVAGIMMISAQAVNADIFIWVIIMYGVNMIMDDRKKRRGRIERRRMLYQKEDRGARNDR